MSGSDEVPVLETGAGNRLGTPGDLEGFCVQGVVRDDRT